MSRAVSTIQILAAKWYAIRDGDETTYPEYRRLQDAIAAERPTSARDVALQYVVTTDEFDSDPPPEFETAMRALADFAGLEKAVQS